MWRDEHLCNHVCVSSTPQTHTRTPWGVKSIALFKQCACVCSCCVHWCGCVNCAVRRTSVLLFFVWDQGEKGNKGAGVLESEISAMLIFSTQTPFHTAVLPRHEKEKRRHTEAWWMPLISVYSFSKHPFFVSFWQFLHLSQHEIKTDLKETLHFFWK